MLFLIFCLWIVKLTARVTFVLPGSSGAPTGGSRIVYEYANRLARKGYRVFVLHAPITRIDPDWKMLAKALVRYPQRLLDRSYRPDAWLKVEPAVTVRWAPTLSARFAPDADVVIATAWKTAEWVARYPASKGRKLYFVQGYEDWDGGAARVDATWRLPMQKIVIARWLQHKAERMGESAVYVPNALDQDQFYVETAPHLRVPYRVAMLYHTSAWKGADEGLRALYALKVEVPELEVELFGVPRRPAELPPWIKYHQDPPQAELRAIYNRAAVFLAPSRTEGWGLPALEAMACGAAVVATDNEGHREFAVDRQTALLVRPGDWRDMAVKIRMLIEDPTLRLKLSTAAIARARTFCWEDSLARFEAVLRGEVLEGTARPDQVAP